MNKINYDFKNRTAIVTGGAQGFGLDIAKRFLDSGGKVIIWDIDKKMIEKANEETEKNVLKTNSEFHILMDNRKKSAEEKVKQMKEQAFKDIKNASVKIAIESVERLIKNSIDKSKLDKFYKSSIEETKLALKKKST